MNYKIMPFSQSDLAAITTIESTRLGGWSAQQVHDFFTATDFINLLDNTAEQKSATKACFVLHKQGNCVAYAMFQSVMNETELLVVAVKKDYRRQGLAIALLKHALAAFQKIGSQCCYLELRVSNAAALALYEALNFQSTGLRKAYYSNTNNNKPEDAITMKTIL